MGRVRKAIVVPAMYVSKLFFKMHFVASVFHNEFVSNSNAGTFLWVTNAARARAWLRAENAEQLIVVLSCWVMSHIWMSVCVSVCCSVLQCVESCHTYEWAIDSSVIVWVCGKLLISNYRWEWVSACATCWVLWSNTAMHCITLQHTATHCNTLQHTATHCNTLQHTATCATCWVLWSNTATHCITLQHAASHCNTLQRTTTHRSTKGTYVNIQCFKSK